MSSVVIDLCDSSDTDADLCDSDVELDPEDVDDVEAILRGKRFNDVKIPPQRRAEIKAAALRYLETAHNKSLGALASKPTAPEELPTAPEELPPAPEELPPAPEELPPEFGIFFHKKAPEWLDKYIGELSTQ